LEANNAALLDSAFVWWPSPYLPAKQPLESQSLVTFGEDHSRCYGYLVVSTKIRDQKSLLAEVRGFQVRKSGAGAPGFSKI
jgi:hypothetical protein